MSTKDKQQPEHPPPNPDGSAVPAAHWVRHPWDAEEPMCVRCGTGLSLLDGCEWDDDPGLNLCHDCALTVIREMRQNTKPSGDEKH